MDHERAGTDRCTRMNRPGRGAGPATRLERDDALRACVLERLSWGWSPEQIAGHLAEAAGRTVISYESIYRFIYAQAARHKNHAWRRYLPRAKWKRGRRRRKGSSSASFIAHRRPGRSAAAAAGAVTPWPGGNPWVRTRPRCAPARLSVSRKGALRRIPRRFRLAPVRPRGRRRPLSPTRGHGPDSRVIQTFVLMVILGSVTGLVKASLSVGRGRRGAGAHEGRPYGRGWASRGLGGCWGWGALRAPARLAARPSLSLSLYGTEDIINEVFAQTRLYTSCRKRRYQGGRIPWQEALRGVLEV